MLSAQSHPPLCDELSQGREGAEGHRWPVPDPASWSRVRLCWGLGDALIGWIEEMSPVRSGQEATPGRRPSITWGPADPKRTVPVNGGRGAVPPSSEASTGASPRVQEPGHFDSLVKLRCVFKFKCSTAK